MTAELGGDAPCWAHLFDSDIGADRADRDDRLRATVAELGSVDITGRAGVVWSVGTAATSTPTSCTFSPGGSAARPTPSSSPTATVIEAHRWLHDADPFDEALFDRWLEIFDATLKDGWSGPITEAASRRGHGIAWAMAKRFTGHGTRRTP